MDPIKHATYWIVVQVWGGVLDCRDLAKTLALVPWTTELNDGRVPSVCSSDPTGKHKLGFWKSEEFSKLALVAH